MSKMSDVYSKAAELVEQGWCQHVMARTSAGHCVASTDPLAVKFCASGALRRARLDVFNGIDNPVFWDAFFKTEFCFTPDGKDANLNKMMAWNDKNERTQEEVIEMFRSAAEQWDGNGTE